ncbi:MAG: hypothetical protein IJ795_08150 [Bacteroidales bacterium]|nr:hypothetical protein [Bacteroidales bacterium]
MRKIKLLSVGVAALAILFGCQQKEQQAGDAPKKGLQTAVFAAETTAVDNTSATFKVTVTENDEATWYCILTDDITSKPSVAVSNALKDINVTRHILEYSHSKDTTFTGLRQGWPYRFIVTGLIANGTTYGEPAVVEFNAGGDIIYSHDELKKNTDIVIEAAVDEEGKATINISHAPEKYTVTVVEESVITSKDTFDGDYADFILADAEATRTAGSFADEIHSGDYTLTQTLESNVKYAIVVYGVTDNFNVTNEYNNAPVAYVTYLPDYEDYVGDWEIKDEAGESLAIWRIAPFEAGKTERFVITGTNLADFTLVGIFNAETHAMYIPAQKLGEDDTYTYLFYGIDQDDYPESAGQNPDNSALLTIYHDEDGTVTATGAEYTAVYSGTEYQEIIVAVGVLCVAADNKFYTADELPFISLPAVLVEGELPDEPSEDPSEEPGEEESAYESWLGVWNVTRGEAKDRWTITEKVAGSSYTITGIDGMNVEIEAGFDEETGSLTLASSASSQAAVNPYATQLVCGLAGMVVYSGNMVPVSGEFPVAVATLSGKDAATLASAGSVTIASKSYDLAGMCIYGLPAGAEDGYVFVTEFTTFPATMTRASGEGGGEEEIGYNTWIGTYSVTLDGNDLAFVVKEGEKDKSLVMVYPEDMYEYEIELTYNAEDNSVTVANGQLVDEYTNQSYGPVKDYLYGGCPSGSNIGPVSGTYPITNATLAADGNSFTFNGGNVLTLTDNTGASSEAEVVLMTVYGIIQEGDYEGYYIDYFSGGTGSDGTVYPELRFFFPLTFTKTEAATSALKAPSRNVFKPYRYMENRGTVKSYKAADGRRAARCYMAESFAGKGAFTLSPMGQKLAR